MLPTVRRVSVETATVAFVRPARSTEPGVCGEEEIVVAAPPPVPAARPARGFLRWMPVVGVLVGGGVLVAFLASGSGATHGTTALLWPIMMVGSLVTTLAYGSGSGTRNAELDQGRDRYLGYLAELGVRMTETAAVQRHRAECADPDPGALWALVGTGRMWERRPQHPDFGVVRIGVGEVDAAVRPVAPAPAALGESVDPVTAEAVRRFVEAHATLPLMPVTVALSRPGITAIEDRGTVRAAVCQVAVMHSPADVMVAVVAAAAERARWEWLKWLPHNRHPTLAGLCGPAPMFYDDVAAALAVERSGRCLVVVADGVEVTGAGDAAVLAVGAGGTSADLPDAMSPTDALACARRLSAYRGSERAERAGDWLDWMGLADIGDVEPDTLWRSRSHRRLRVPLGLCTTGEPLELDIREAAEGGMGPHGLCVGATGSGKSELLRTVALGMIAGHPPDVLNLILVDFKGGATFLGLDRARHVAAVITNLADEAPFVERMQDALLGEVNRRQRMLRDAGNLAGIAEYQRSRAEGAALPVLPTLFVIVDEFSELLSQHPDFLDVFVAIGRLGRSLGIHLLLASQRLDEGRLRGLETHLSYRICLKTLSAGESRAVLGVPDAYHLPGAPGAAYLKVGSGEPVRFQSVTVSAQCAGTAAAVVPLAGPVPFTAAPLGADAPPEHGAASGPRLLDTVLDALAGHGAPAHPVWLPPLERSPGLGAVLAETGGADLVVPIGLADNVFEHRRSVMLVDLSGAAGHVAVVGAPQAGKTTALRTLVLALAATHDPRQIQLYCLDFGGGLSTLAGLPHVGAVAGRRDPELVARVVAEIAALTRRREARFAAHGIDSIAEYRRRRAGRDPATLDDPFGDVFLAIDGWAVLRQDFDTLDTTITALAAEGLSVGVHVLLSANRWADIRPALRDQIGTRIELRLGDPLDSEIDRARARNVPSGRPGRGLTGQGMPLTIALPRLDDADPATHLAVRHGDSRAPEIRALPTRVDHRTLAVPRRGLLLGVDEVRLEPVALDFHAQPHLLILGDTGAGKTATLRTLCHEIVRAAAGRPARLIVVDPRRTLPDLSGAERVDGPAQLGEVVDDLLSSLGPRMAGRRRDEPDVHLVVDDYDLVSTANPNPLQALQSLVPHARDIGLHLVVARRSAGAARALYEPFLAAIRECDAMGLQMSVGTDEGPLFAKARPRPLPPGRATLVSRAAGEVLVQVAWIDPP